MDKALRGQGCVMKRSKKKDGGAMRPMPENLKEYLSEKSSKEDKETPRRRPKRMSKKGDE